MIFIIILTIIAALCSALRDTLAHHWYIFRWKDSVNEIWWNPQISWKNKYNFIKFWGKSFKIWDPISDWWHILKSIEICCLMGAISVNTTPILSNVLLDFLLKAIVLGIIWIIVFNLGYNKLFVKKPLK